MLFALDPGGSGGGMPSPDDDFWYQPAGHYTTDAGVRITPDTAMRVSAVRACVRVISEALASLPLITYRRLPNGGKERAPDHPLYAILHDAPNDWQTSFEWREMMQGHLCLRGNALSEIVGDRRNPIAQLIPLHPDRVQVDRLTNNRLRYRVRDAETGTERRLVQDEVLHIRGYSPDGVWGLSPIDLCRVAVGLAMAAEVYGAATFKNGARPGVVLEAPGNLTAPAQAQLRNDWERMHGGPYSARRTAVLAGGLKAHELGMTNEQLLYIELRQFQIEDIARIFGVQQHKVGKLDRSTNNNIEHQGIEFVVDTLRPWLVRWEQSIQRSLFGEDSEYFAEYLIDGLLRGDAKSRAEACQIRFQNGNLSIDEWRAIENGNPLPDANGQRYFIPLNLSPLDRIDEAIDAKIAPAAQSTPPNNTNGNAAAIGVFIDDAANRIAHVLVSDVAKRADKADEDRDRFNTWIATHFQGRTANVRLLLTPISRAAGTLGLVAFDCDAVAGLIIAGCAEEIAGVDPVALVECWKENLSERIKQQIREAVHRGTARAA